MDIASLNSGRNFGNWFHDQVFTEMRKQLRSLRAPLPLMEIFGGLSAGHIAIAALGCRPDLKMFCDTNPDLTHWNSQVHTIDSAVHCGPTAGDILLKDVKSLPRVMIIVAAPPCQWGVLVKHKRPPKQGMQATRYMQTFFYTLDIIVDQARSGSLLMFVFEIVSRFFHRQSDGTLPVDEAFQLLRDKLPSDWVVDHHDCNAKDFGLAQNRPRMYITGRKTLCTPTGKRRLPAEVECFKRKPRVCEFARVSLPADVGARAFGHGGRGYSPQQQSTLRQWRIALKTQLTGESFRGECIFFSYNYPPFKKIHENCDFRLEICECLSAWDYYYHCFSLGDNAKSRDSFMLPGERAALQGFPSDYIVDDHRSQEACFAVGNSPAVPVLAAVLFRELLFKCSCTQSVLTLLMHHRQGISVYHGKSFYV